MAFLSGKTDRTPDDGDEIEIDEQPTQPLPAAWATGTAEPLPDPVALDTLIREARERAQERIQQEQRVCPVCLYYAEQCGECVTVGAAMLRLCADHMAATREAKGETRLLLREQTRRAFNWYFWPHAAGGGGGFGPGPAIPPGGAGDDWGGNDGHR